MQQLHFNRVTIAGLLITLGIVFGDIGTSPLYVFRAILGTNTIDEQGVLGSLSCIIWTMTLLATGKYILLTVRADNKGEGGILSLYALVRRKAPWLVIPALIGASMLLADGFITPPISVTSAVEGLRILSPNIPVVAIVVVILVGLFSFQQFGTKVVGRAFGPAMLVWFTMLAVLGFSQISQNWIVLQSLNPMRALDFVINYPRGFWLLGAVFLCTTGAEALYNDLGHCGRKNIQAAWGYVKLCLLLNYFGQGAWLLNHIGQSLGAETGNAINPGLDTNPFFAIMPDWWLIPGIIIATLSTIIASQALITASYTLISEAMRLNLWPKVRIEYPTNLRGQVYIPSINWILLCGCIFIVLYFRESSRMEAAYGLAITSTMMMTSILLGFWLSLRKAPRALVIGLPALFLTIEGIFLVANSHKFVEGGWVAFAFAGIMIVIMFTWFRSRKVKNRFVDFVRVDKYLPQLTALSEDKSIPKFATNLVFLTSADYSHELEQKIVYSIFNKQPKRADTYWFLHVDVLDEPHTMEYRVTTLVPEKIFRVEFRLGFRMEPRVSLYFRKVIEDLTRNKEVSIMSRYESLAKFNVVGDFRFVVIERILSRDVKLTTLNKMVMTLYNALKGISLSESKAFGLDTSSVTLEKVPLVSPRPQNDVVLTRVG